MKRTLSGVAALLLLTATLVSPPAQASQTVNCSTVGSITIVNNVVTTNSACTGSVAIPDTVTEIGLTAFQNATGLTAVTFGQSSQLSVIEASAFSGATSLTTIAIPSSVTRVSGNAFMGATSLTSVSFGENSLLQVIGTSAFQGATALTSVAFGANSRLSIIGDAAFQLTTSLQSISLPDTVTAIGFNAFNFATALRSVSFGPNSQLASIGPSAFQNATSLQSITLPRTLSQIWTHAFSGASALASVTFLGGAPIMIGSAHFQGRPSGAKALVSRAHIGAGAGKFGNVGSTWNGLVVEVPTSTLSLNSEGTVTSETLEFGLAPTNPQLTRSGFTLAGWSSTQGSAATFAADLSDFTMGPTAQTLFAVWEEDPVEVPSSSVTTASEEVAHPFSGPLLHKVDRRVFNADESSTITFQGKRLHRIESVKIDGVALEVISKSRDQITLALPAMTTGSYTLVLESKSGKLTLARFITLR